MHQMWEEGCLGLFPTVDSEIFARILFSRVVLKVYLPCKKFATSI